jgi:phosphatidyl-myo-inositol alpha-mannosyltransferase
MTAREHGRQIPRHVGAVVAGILLAGILAFALSRLGLHRIGHALVSARPGWVLLALLLMMTSMLFRAASWHETLRAALPKDPIGWMAVARATMIGVMGSAVFPGRIGEPTRVIVVSRRLDGQTLRVMPVVAGTVFSQTLINLLALAALAAVTFTSVPLLKGHEGGLVAAIAVPALICALVVTGPRLVALGRRSRSARIRRATDATARMLNLARQGLVVFLKPRHGAAAIVFQLLAWVLQWLACYMALLAFGLPGTTDLATAAAVLLAVNVSAVLPATPSNIGVFQAACLVVLAAYKVGAGTGLAYGIILQAVEVVTALALGLPALLSEGMTWGDIRGAARRGPRGQLDSTDATADSSDATADSPGERADDVADARDPANVSTS